MLPGILSGVVGAAGALTSGSSMRQVINALGLTSGLKLLLDAGDAASVASGSQDKWTDLSGNGYDFWRGNDGGSGGDPTFTGTIGRQSSGEYWTSSSGFFTYDSANETWMENLHKDGARFTFAMWVRIASSSSEVLMLTSPGAGVGVTLQIRPSTPDTRIVVWKGLASIAFEASAAGSIATSSWTFVALSIDEAAGTYRWNINGTAASGACTYATPSAGSATDRMTLMSMSAGDNRIAQLAAWEGTALSAAQLASLFTATRGKFGV